MNQKEGVFAAVTRVFDVDGAAVPATGSWTEAQSNEVYGHLFQLFKSGQVEYRGGVPADDKLKKYIPGLVNNWVRKDTRLNGGSKYQTKRPGIRTGSGDETLKEMRKLLSVTTDLSAKEKIQEAIDSRMAELKAENAPEIDVSKLPEHLRQYAKA